MITYLVTGGAGFIGSNIVEALVRLKETRVRVIDNFATGKKENLTPFLDKIELVEGDIRDKALMQKVCRGIDVVLHQAALRSVPSSIDDPVSTNDINVAGTLNVLMAGRECSVKRVVYASSSSVYGDTDLLLKKEGQKPEPISPYAVSKLAGEYYCQVFQKIYGLETIILRYFNVFGPRQDPFSEYAAVIPNFILAVLGNNPLRIYGDGRQSRDFTYVGNVVEANLKASAMPGRVSGIFNVACQEAHTVRELAESIMEITGHKVSIEFSASRKGDVRHSLADISQAKQVLDYEPKVNFSEGLKRTAAWFRKRG